MNNHDKLHYLSNLDGLQKDDKWSDGSYDCRASIDLYRPIVGLDWLDLWII